MEYNDQYNKEAEESVLGSILLEPELIKDVIVRPDQMTAGTHSNLLATMLDLDAKGKPVEMLNILERVGTNNLDRVGGLSFLSSLAASIVSTTNFENHQNLILEYYNRRESSKIGLKLSSQEIDSDEAIEALNKILDNESQDDDGDITDAIFETYDAVLNATGDVTGIPTKYRDIDKMTGGYQGGQLIIVGARPSIGKTAFAINIGLNAMQKPDETGDIVAIFSYEMGKRELLKRAAASLNNIDLQRMKWAGTEFRTEDWKKLNDSLGTLSKSDLKIFDNANMNINFIWSKVRKLKRKNPDRRVLVIIDYLQLIVPVEHVKGNRTQEISDISQGLKRLARAENVPVIALSQLSRGVEQRQDKRPMLSDLRESGSIEQDADIVKFLYREDYYDKETEDTNMLEIIIAKHRDGPTGSVKLAFVKEYGKILNIDWSGTDPKSEQKGWSN